jgi:hypothetical protein
MKTTTKRKGGEASTRAGLNTPAVYRVADFQNDFLAKTCGIHPGDSLLLVYADEDREPQAGEVVFMHFARTGGGCGPGIGCIDGGRFYQRAKDYFRINHDDTGGRAVNRKGSTYYPHSRQYLMRVVAVERPDGTVSWLAGDGERLEHIKPRRLPTRRQIERTLTINALDWPEVIGAGAGRLLRRRKATVPDITQWRLWRQMHNTEQTARLMRKGYKHPEQSFPIKCPLEQALSGEPKPKGPAQIIPFRKGS